MKKKQTKITAKAVSLLLAAAMLLTVQGTPALADTVGEQALGEEREMPKNPVHHCTKEDDGTDTTEWSYVYFGSYPQTEVTGDALTAAIAGASYDTNGDAWVDGTKYRRISKSDTNSDDYFGDSIYRYFKWEQIKWRVLQNDGNTLFVLADKGLDCKDYHDVAYSCTWESCTLRNWLNNDFYGAAFGSNEQGAIVSQTVANKDNPDYDTDGGYDTTDKVFLLSLSEVMNPDYGFCESSDADSASRRVKASDYAHARGTTLVNTNHSDYKGCSRWWVRSPGRFAYYAATVASHGHVDIAGNYGYINEYACLPALHIDLSSDLWSVADDGNSGEELIQVKEQYKAGLDTYKNASDYRQAQQKELAEAIAAGKAAIDAAADETAANNALAAAKAAIDKIKTDAQLTEEEKGNGNKEEKPDPSKTTPKPTSIKGKIKAKKKAFLVTWKKQGGATGYQVQYSANKKFTKKATKTKTVNGASKTKLTVKKLKAGKKYYVRVRTVQKVNGTPYYSKWSKAKTVKTKK